MRSSPSRVLVYTPYRLQYFREVLLGVRHYGFDTGRLVFMSHWSDDQPIQDLKAFVRRNAIKGIIVCLHDPATEKIFEFLSLPIINISNTLPESKIPLVTQDDHQVGRVAARHLIDCGCQAFCFWGQPGGQYSEERLSGFREELVKAGFGSKLSVDGGEPEADKKASLVYRRMMRWLAAQPRPLGVFAALDSYAIALLRAAGEIGWRVPEDMAVLGAGNDDLYVQFESIPLSSVELPSRRIGYEAARLLDQMISRKQFIARSKRLPVSEVASRKSSDVLYVRDPFVSRAALYIRENAVQDLYIKDIAQASGVCRTELQQRFRAELGRSILAEVLRIRIGMAQSLLARTDLPMSLVAERCGFANSQRLCLLFRRVVGLSPKAYRKRLTFDSG
jgi:LacI family transcriptional regulator